MKKYLKLFVMAVVAVATLSLSSCSKDDPEVGFGTLTINGTKYKLAYHTQGGFYDPDPGQGVFTITVENGSKNYSYIFSFWANEMPEVGENLGYYDLTMRGGDETLTTFGTLDFVGGEVTIKSLSNGFITLEFDNCEMYGTTDYYGHEKVTYEFDGTVKIPFEVR